MSGRQPQLHIERSVNKIAGAQGYLGYLELINFVNLQQTRQSQSVATCHLQTCYNLLKQLAASLWITSFDNQLATSLLTTCNRTVVNKLSQAMRTLLIKLLKKVKRHVETCRFLAVCPTELYIRVDWIDNFTAIFEARLAFECPFLSEIFLGYLKGQNVERALG